MYLDYWKLNRNPFDNVPDPRMYFPEHSTVEGTVSELLFAIEEANECLAVVVGDVGLGKTMSMRVVLNELDHEKYRIAYITNPDVTFNQLLRDIIGQLEGERCELRNREALLEEFNALLFKVSDERRKVLIFVDEGNALRSVNLEGLRLLTNMQEDEKNLFTLIIAGQPKLAKMLRDPRRVNIYQRIGVFCNLEPMDHVETVEAYIRYRLAVAGASDSYFDRSGYQAVFERSGGIPRLINRLCKLSLKAAETNSMPLVTGELVHQVADRFSPLENGRSVQAERIAATVAEPEKSISNSSQCPEIESTLTPESPSPIQEAAPENSLIDFSEIIKQTERAKEAERIVEKEPDIKKTRKKIQLLGVTRKSIFELKDMANPRDKLRYAGLLAARELKIHPERFEGIDSDPVRIWDDLRRAIIEAV